VADENEEDIIMEQYESESDVIDQSESDIESEITQSHLKKKLLPR
jgi:hypothetical protein